MENSSRVDLSRPCLLIDWRMSAPASPSAAAFLLNVLVGCAMAVPKQSSSMAAAEDEWAAHHAVMGVFAVAMIVAIVMGYVMGRECIKGERSFTFDRFRHCRIEY